MALDWPPAQPMPVFAGATGDRTLRLSGECADGTILTAGTTPAGVTRARRLIDEGRGAAGRTDPHTVVLYLHATTGADAAQRLERERVEWGYDTMTDRAVSGGADEVAAGVRRFAAAGADVVVLQPSPDDPDPEGFVHFAAAEVAPLLN